jgi:hypothetical protein
MSEVNIMIQLRHGTIQATADYVSRLPTEVVDEWAKWSNIDSAWVPGLLIISLRKSNHQDMITELLQKYYSQDHE